MSKDATPTEDRRPRREVPRKSPWLVRVAFAWSQLLFAFGLLRVAAVVAELLPATWLARSLVGPGNLAAVGACLAAVGFLLSLLVGRRVSGWRRLGLLVLLVLHAVVAVVFPPRWLLDRFQEDQTLFYVSTERSLYALTIDDGLDPEATPVILDVLGKHGAKATFFVLGETLEGFPDLAERCVAEGHELANHQMTETPAVSLEADELETRMREADRLLRRFGEPMWFRPGGGIGTDRSQAVAQRLGYQTALASVFPFDSHITSVRFHVTYLTGRTEAGDIVVLHDGGDRGLRTAATLDAALEQLAERGLAAVTLSELVKNE
ncbi:MAG: polysaccharide deacetylase family protein [Planctomycetota bacterium]